MSSTIKQTQETISKHGGKASKHQVARELKISLDYAGLILGELKRKGEISFSDGFYTLTSARKSIAQDEKRKKQAISSKSVGRRSKRLKGAKKIPTRTTGRGSSISRSEIGTKKSRTEKYAPHPLISILGISESLARTLEKAGYKTIESLANAPIEKLMQETKSELHEAAGLINQARKILNF